MGIDRGVRSLGSGIPGFWELPAAVRANVLRGFQEYHFLPTTFNEPEDVDPGAYFEQRAERFARYLSAPYTILSLDPRKLGAAERALVIHALLQPVEVGRWAAFQPDEE